MLHIQRRQENWSRNFGIVKIRFEGLSKVGVGKKRVIGQVERIDPGESKDQNPGKQQCLSAKGELL